MRKIGVLLFASVLIVSTFSLPLVGTAVQGRMVLDVGRQWDRYVARPSVVHVSSKFMMWYAGDSRSDGNGIENIGLAMSPDGITWEKYDQNPVLTVGSGWESDSVNDPWVIWDGSQYRMWYTGWSHNGELAQIGYATSSDGIHWTKFGSNPVLSLSSDATDGQWASRPIVISSNGWFGMYYTARSTKTEVSNLLMAASKDGTRWTKSQLHPGIPTGGWDSQQFVGGVNVLGSTYLAFYWSRSGNENYRIGYAASTDGISWNPIPSNPVISYGSGLWDANGVVWAMMIPVGTSYYVYYVGIDSSDTGRIGLAVLPAPQ